MFSGLGSISDLNQQFAQFTSNLTNLDSLQDGSASSQSNAFEPKHNEQKLDSLRTLEAENAALRVELQTQQSLVEDLKAYLSIKDHELNLKETEADGFRDSIRTVERAEAHSAKELTEYKTECEKRIHFLTDKVIGYERREDDLLAAQKGFENVPGQPLFSKSEDRNIPNSVTNHEAILAESQEAYIAAQQTITDLTRRLGLVTSDLARAQRVETELRTEVKLELEKSLSLNSLVEDMRVQLWRADESNVTSTDESQAKLKEQAAVIERLEADMQGYLNNIVELNEEHNTTLARCASAESRCAALEERLRTVLESSEQRSASTSDALGELGRVRELAEDRARLVQEAENKVATLTEKLKDMMHRFAELKSKSSAQAQQMQERVAEITKLAQAKDSEILGLRLKIENSERSGSDVKLKVAELAERYGEAQRELTRLRDGAEELQAEIVALTEEKDRHIAALSVCEVAKDELAATLQLAEVRAPTQTAAYESHMRELETRLARKDEESAEQLAQLRAEVDAAHSRLRAEEDSAGNLDNYKKRAQLALKKANSTNAALTAEVQRLQAALEEVSVRFAEACDSSNVLTASLADVKLSAESMRAERDALENALADAQAQCAETKQAMETKEGELKAFLAAHTAMDNHPEAGNAGGRRERGGVAAIPALTIPPVSAAPTQGSSATAHREASSPGEGVSPSADSELVANATDYCASPRGNDIRGSSWAMVAASGSRTTSTHPSTTSMSEEGSRPPVVLHLVEPSLDAPDGRADFKTALSSDSLLFISQLHSQLDALRKELSQRGIDLEAVHQQLQYEKEEKRVLKNRVEELMAYLERTKQLHEGPDSAINMEYLKNCMLKFMSSSDLSERRRLYPVIATILKLTSQETKAIEVAFQVTEERDNEFQNTLSSIGSFATSSIGSFWGSATGTS